MLNTERLLIAARTNPGPHWHLPPPPAPPGPRSCRNRLSLRRRLRVLPGAGGRLAPSPAKANCGVARETGSKNRTAGWLRVGEAETTSPAQPPSVILGPIRAEAVALCSLFTKHFPGEGEEGEGRKSRAGTVPVPLLPPPWRIRSDTGQGEGVN